jgi:hypothetical protein
MATGHEGRFAMLLDMLSSHWFSRDVFLLSCTVVNVYYFYYPLIFLENYNLLFYTSSRIGSKTRYSRIACAAEANSAE